MNKIRYYEIEAKEVDLFGNLREICFADNILQNISKNSRSLIDIACGDGYILYEALKSKKPHIRNIYGLDLANMRLQRTKKFVPKTKLVQGSIFNLPFKNNSFDAVVCSETLEHLENYQNAISELIRITKKELLITVPNEEILSIERCPRCNHHFHINDHINSFNGKILKAVIKQQSDEVRIKKTIKFHTIFSYNNKTINFPKCVRMLLDKTLVLLSKKLPFFKPNYLLISVKKIKN